MNISGKELKEIIPDEALFCLDSVQILERDSTHVIVNLGHKHGGMSILVYRKSLGKILLRAPETPQKAEKITQTPAAVATESSQKVDDSEDGRVYTIGMTRKKDGVLQRLEGFSASSSVREKPRTAQRRVQHPETKNMVWPLWVEVKE